MISIKTIDSTRYDLPVGTEYQTVERYGRIWIYFQVEGKEKYISLDSVMCISEKPDD